MSNQTDFLPVLIEVAQDHPDLTFSFKSLDRGHALKISVEDQVGHKVSHAFYLDSTSAGITRAALEKGASGIIRKLVKEIKDD